MEKRYENEEMEIDLLELFYVLRSKILAILMCGIIYSAVWHLAMPNIWLRHSTHHLP